MTKGFWSCLIVDSISLVAPPSASFSCLPCGSCALPLIIHHWLPVILLFLLPPAEIVIPCVHFFFPGKTGPVDRPPRSGHFHVKTRRWSSLCSMLPRWILLCQAQTASDLLESFMAAACVWEPAIFPAKPAQSTPHGGSSGLSVQLGNLRLLILVLISANDVRFFATARSPPRLCNTENKH